MVTASSRCASGPIEIAVPARPSLLVAVGDTIVGWMLRSRERRMLGEMDDRMLRDVGVARSAILAEAAKPFWRP